LLMALFTIIPLDRPSRRRTSTGLGHRVGIAVRHSLPGVLAVSGTHHPLPIMVGEQPLVRVPDLAVHIPVHNLVPAVPEVGVEASDPTDHQRQVAELICEFGKPGLLCA
jgi:hypothetical protein